jgi:hypothetical protein
MASSIGFRDSVSFLPTIQATGFLTVALVGLPPTEYASLRWTHLHAGLSRRTPCPSAAKILPGTAPVSPGYSTPYRPARKTRPSSKRPDPAHAMYASRLPFRASCEENAWSHQRWHQFGEGSARSQFMTPKWSGERPVVKRRAAIWVTVAIFVVLSLIIVALSIAKQYSATLLSKLAG